jgi:1-deoxy-D-xylulose-5-phosphate synthase
VALLVFGTLMAVARQAAQALDLTLVDKRFVKPIDHELIIQIASEHSAIVTLEEGSIMGGAGSAVAESLAAAGLTVPLLQLGLPDRFIDHGEQATLLKEVGLDAAGIENAVRERFYLQK